jgi:hypothetical protein
MVVFVSNKDNYYHIRALSSRASWTVSHCGKDYTWYETTSVEWDHDKMCPGCLLGLMGA